MQTGFLSEVALENEGLNLQSVVSLATSEILYGL